MVPELASSALQAPVATGNPDEQLPALSEGCRATGGSRKVSTHAGRGAAAVHSGVRELGARGLPLCCSIGIQPKAQTPFRGSSILSSSQAVTIYYAIAFCDEPDTELLYSSDRVSLAVGRA